MLPCSFETNYKSEVTSTFITVNHFTCATGNKGNPLHEALQTKWPYQFEKQMENIELASDVVNFLVFISS